MATRDARTHKSEDVEGGAIGLLVCVAPSPFGVLLEEGVDLAIGRDAEVAIDHESVSRRHARIEWRAGKPFVSDEGSTNGTAVDGRKLTREERAPLVVGSTLVVGRVSVVVQPADMVSGLVRKTSAAQAPNGVVVRDPKMQELYALLGVIAPSEIAILVLGETGSGKEVFASSVHRLSNRSTGPFLAVSCAALPEALLESELFGYERGAFTGANQTKEGLFEAANGGTLFLDEIGEITLSTQAKLLRVLETGEIMRLGSTRTRDIDVRIVAATNRDLEQRIEEGSFRSDLYFRIAGMVLRLPPLRERPNDVEALALHFVETNAKKAKRSAPNLGPGVLAALQRHPWPGNARELRNVIQRAFVLSGTTGEIQLAHLGLESAPRTSAVPARAQPTAHLRDAIDHFERDRIVQALEEANGNQTRAAEKLGIARRTLITKIEQYGLARPRKRDS